MVLLYLLCSQSTVFLEPFSIDAKQPIKNIIPAFMYGAELSSQGHKCSEPGFDYDQFYSIWKCPRIVVEAAVGVFGFFFLFVFWWLFQ